VKTLRAAVASWKDVAVFCHVCEKKCCKGDQEIMDIQLIHFSNLSSLEEHFGAAIVFWRTEAEQTWSFLVPIF
jgi:hypothetical protein